MAREINSPRYKQHHHATQRRNMAPKILKGQRILRWAHGGDAVVIPTEGELSGRIIFVESAVPGDVVTLQLTEVQKRFARATVAHIESPSPERVPLRCDKAHVCGGCPWMEGSAEAQRASREAILKGETQKVLGQGEALVQMAPSGPELGYRQRLRLGYRVDQGVRGPKVTLGLRARKSHDLVDLPSCPIAHPALSAKFDAIRSHLAERYANSAGMGRVSLLVGQSVVDGQESVAGFIEPEGEEGYSLFDTDIWVTLGEYRQRLHPAAFAQANATVTGQMLATVEAWAKKARASYEGEGLAPATEFFAGSGTLTQALWKAGYEVNAYEIDPRAKPAFERTQAFNDEVAQSSTWHAIDLSAGLVWPAPARSPHLIVLDPPRTGARELMTWVSKTPAKYVIYISCDLANGLRDVASLVKAPEGEQAPYRLLEVVGLDMFPHTGHQEVLMLLERV